MVPPADRRYLWSPVWARVLEDPKCEPEVISLSEALGEVVCEDCREDLVVSHVEVLGQWTMLARELLAKTARKPDPRRDEVARVLVFFAGDLGRALTPGGIITELDPDLVLLAMEAISEAVVVVSSCFAHAFSKQLASTG